MPDDNTASTSPAAPRPKPARSATAGTVRARASPTPGSSGENGDRPPPTKRARKAINCEPCRGSKLKCDRNRPCSSCVLRGTSASCYQDSRGHDGSESVVRGDDHHFNRIDPAQEIARLRHSVSLLEAYIFPNQRSHPVPHRRASEAASLVPKKENVDMDFNDKNAPGMLGCQGQGGLFAGPTSAAIHLSMSDTRGSDEADSRQQSQEAMNDDFSAMAPEYDRDLLAMLPSLEIIDGLISYYFEHCNWIYRHVNQPAFNHHWERFKSGASADRIVLATACSMMAVAVHFLPAQHHLLEGFNESHEEIGLKFYEVSGTALQRRMSDSRAYSLELVELLLNRTHYLTLSKNDTEEIWHIKGEVVTIGLALGLHRDPGKWKMHRDVAERRRWAWWHIILLERWQAFMFGRPIVIASHHFDTQLPSYCDPALDKTGRLYLPNVALFRLAFVLGDIMDDAVSVRPVPYENVLANDRALTQWMDNIPPELDLDEYRLARSLASSSLAIRRLGVQSVIIRTSYNNIRFTLHRPYASAPLNPVTGVKTSGNDPSKSAQSLEIAVGAADKLITMVGQSRPDFLANSSLAVPAHMNWGPSHCFSAAMFFSFQLIANPDQPGAGLFRASICKAINTLEQFRGNGVADKALNILQTLAPLYSIDFPQESPEAREKLRAQVLGTVRKLAFPYHDSHGQRKTGDSPNGRGTLSSPSSSNSVSPPMTMVPSLPQPYDNMSAIRTAPTIYSHQPQTSMSQSPQGGHLSPSIITHPSYPQPYIQPHHYTDGSRYSQYVHPVDESAIWGAAVGFEHGEWTQLMGQLQPDPSGRHMQNS
ncbi:fungal-specific transcription factor domain-containing protein [Infundibulicybe gibba]|nr:fungal-specific transcription factor domain-containing protein [Infundibulicybe gibba]